MSEGREGAEDKRKTLRDVLDELDAYMEKFEVEVHETAREAISRAGLTDKPFVAGFSFKVGPGGKPSVQIFGDNPVKSGGFRSPLTEQILDEKGSTLKLVLDMPGVEKTDIRVDATDDSAVVTAERDTRKYRAEVSLKAAVDAQAGKAEYRNGLLEISFPLKGKANKDFRRLDVV